MPSFNSLDRLIRSLRLRRIRCFIPTDSAVCDVGCGDGTVLRGLCREGSIREGLGLDPQAVPGREGGCEIIQADLLSAALPGERFDAVLMLAVLEHLDSGSVEPFLRDVHRILKPEGLLIITTPTPLSKPLLEFLAFRAHLISEHEIRGHRRYYRRTDLESLARRMDYEILKAARFQGGLNSFYVLKKTGPVKAMPK